MAHCTGHSTNEPGPMPIWTAASVESCMIPSASAARDQEVDPVNNGADRDGQDTPPAGTTHDGYMNIPAGMAENREDLCPALTMDDFRSGAAPQHHQPTPLLPSHSPDKTSLAIMAD